MPNDTTWDDVWAEYDARNGRTAAPAGGPTPWYLVPGYGAPEAPPQPRRRPRHWRLPRPRMVLAGLVLALITVLGLPFIQGGGPAIASHPAPEFQRQTMIVIGLAGQGDVSESPATKPAPQEVLAEATLLDLPPPAWVLAEANRPSAAPATTLSEPRAQAPRRIGQRQRSGQRQPAQLARQQRHGGTPIASQALRATSPRYG